jgi:tetratricopeptide (TPR) repeat protein
MKRPATFALLATAALICNSSFATNKIENVRARPAKDIRAGSPVTIIVNGDEKQGNNCGFRIDFGDGTGEDVKVFDNLQFPRTFTKVYANPGNYTVNVEGRRVTTHLECIGSARITLAVGGAGAYAPGNAAQVSTAQSAPMIRNMVSAAIAGDEAGVHRHRRDIDALPRPAAGDRNAARNAAANAAAATQRGDTQAALDQYQYAVSLDPTDAAAYNGLGQTQARLGRYADADVSLSRALTLAPGNAAIWSSFGTTLARSGHVQNAPGALVNSYIFAVDRRSAIDALQRLANSKEVNVSAAAQRALQSPIVVNTRPR